MRVSYRVAILRREVEQLAAIVVERMVEAERVRAAPSFRPLTESETATIVGADLMAALGGARRRD